MSEQKDYRKLCMFNVESISDEEIQSLCEEFAEVKKLNRPANNNRLAFVLFKDTADAKIVMEGLVAKGLRVNYANAQRATDNSSEKSDGRPKWKEFRSPLKPAPEHVMGDTDVAEADSTEPDDNTPYGICLRCGDKAYFNCGRCCDFYCSEECQSSDWLSHKRNCFPKPKLVPSKSLYNLNASRANVSSPNVAIRENVSKPVKKVEKLENNGSTEVDAADGHEKVPQSPPVEPAIHVTEDDENNKMSARQKIILLSSYCGSDAGANVIPLESIPNDSEVYITHVKNYSTVYIRSITTGEEFTQLINEVNSAAATAPKLGKVNRNVMVMAPFDGMYYRAMVINSNDQTGQVHVGYIDYGNDQVVGLSSLKELPKELKEHSRYTFLVKLKDPKDDPEPNEIAAMTKYLESLSENETCAPLKVKSDSSQIEKGTIVELFDVVSNESINEILGGMCQKRYRMSDLKQVIVNDSNHVLMMIGSDRIHENIITCIRKDDVNVFMVGDEKTQAYGKSVATAPAYKPKEKEVCIALVKDVEGYVWYRCLYQQELANEKAQVYCFDYGKIDTVRENNIRAMKEELAHQITSFVCRIKNSDGVNAAKAINENAEFKPTSIEYDGNSHVITMAF